MKRYLLTYTYSGSFTTAGYNGAAVISADNIQEACEMLKEKSPEARVTYVYCEPVE